MGAAVGVPVGRGVSVGEGAGVQKRRSAGFDEHFIISSTAAMMQAVPRAIMAERLRGNFIMGDPGK